VPALNRDRATPYREGVEVAYPVAAGLKIYAVSLVCTNAHGFAAPGADTSGYRLAGVALEQLDNAGGADGAKSVRVRRQGIFEFDAVSITQAMVGGPMYAVDDHTFCKGRCPCGCDEHFPNQTSKNLVKVGVLVKYGSPTSGWIDIAR
jgi:hypothetical protein